MHYLKQDDHKPHDILLCIGTGKNVQDTDRLRYPGDQFYLKTAGRDAAGLQGSSRCAGEHAAHRRTLRRQDRRRQVSTCRTSRCRPAITLDSYFEKVVRDGFAQRLPRLLELRDRGALRHTLEEYETRLPTKSTMIKQMEYPGYFLIVWDFIRYAREQGIPVGPGRGSAAGAVVA